MALPHFSERARIMEDRLRLNENDYEVCTFEHEGRSIRYRAFRNIRYCLYPADEIQKMNIFVPEAYYHDESIGKYDRHNAPYFMPNTVGGYMPGPSEEPGIEERHGRLNSLFLALERGYIAVSAGVRGRTSGKKATEFFEGSVMGALGKETGKMCGRAPAFIVDLKAAVRFLRHNKDLLPGDTDKIVTNGTSAGGALSALAGASGNHEGFEVYLEQIGAAKERDDIFAASCYCPIHNLENADMAYEWQFCGHNDYYRTKHQRTETGFIRVPDEGMMSEKQIKVSQELKKAFPSYLNSLHLKDEQGKLLSLNEEGEGSFMEYVKGLVVASADEEYVTKHTQKELSYLSVSGSQIQEQDYLQVKDGRVKGLDYDAYIGKITRMKAAPAFDALDLRSPENDEFGDENCDGRHFTEISMRFNEKEGAQMADKKIIDLMNPTFFIRNENADIARHWHIRHGAFDRDTSLAIPVILTLLLKNRGYDANLKLPWGLPHCGDYDMEELFAWIDSLS